MSFKRWFLEKRILYLMAFSAFYLIGATFGIIPEPVKDAVSWFDRNFNTLALAMCFLALLYVFYKIKMRRAEPSE